MRVLAENKDEVLEYFENKFKDKNPNTEPVYRLSEDDYGNYYLVISGFSFSGKGEIHLDGNILELANGLVVNIIKK